MPSPPWSLVHKHVVFSVENEAIYLIHCSSDPALGDKNKILPESDREKLNQVEGRGLGRASRKERLSECSELKCSKLKVMPRTMADDKLNANGKGCSPVGVVPRFSMPGLSHSHE